jgi:hypothetical protein
VNTSMPRESESLRNYETSELLPISFRSSSGGLAKNTWSSVESRNPNITIYGQDVVLQNQEIGLFGVFDGAGGEPGDPTKAAMIAAHTMDKQPWGLGLDIAELRHYSDSARKAVSEISENLFQPPGVTVGLTAKLEITG